MGLAEILKLIEGGSVGGIIVASVAVVVIIGGGLLLKNKAVVGIGEKDKLVDGSRLEAIDKKLGQIDSRLTSVERDVATRATTEEVHRMELAFTRLEGRIQAMDGTAAATKESVTRIEGFMLKAAEAALLKAAEIPRVQK